MHYLLFPAGPLNAVLSEAIGVASNNGIVHSNVLRIIHLIGWRHDWSRPSTTHILSVLMLSHYSIIHALEGAAFCSGTRCMVQRRCRCPHGKRAPCTLLFRTRTLDTLYPNLRCCSRARLLLVFLCVLQDCINSVANCCVLETGAVQRLRAYNPAESSMPRDRKMLFLHRTTVVWECFSSKQYMADVQVRVSYQNTCLNS